MEEDWIEEYSCIFISKGSLKKTNLVLKNKLLVFSGETIKHCLTPELAKLNPYPDSNARNIYIIFSLLGSKSDLFPMH